MVKKRGRRKTAGTGCVRAEAFSLRERPATARILRVARAERTRKSASGSPAVCFPDPWKRDAKHEPHRTPSGCSDFVRTTTPRSSGTCADPCGTRQRSCFYSSELISGAAGRSPPSFAGCYHYSITEAVCQVAEPFRLDSRREKCYNISGQIRNLPETERYHAKIPRKIHRV